MSVDTPGLRRQVLWQLARPRTVADRQRFRRMALGVAGSGALLLAALAIFTVSAKEPWATVCDDSGCWTEYRVADLAPFVAERGLRGGTALGALLLVVPFVLLALQALRTGTAARERRLAALSLAGATQRDLRRLASLEGTYAAGAGALLAGPVYLGLWLILGRLLPAGAKLLPQPGVLVSLGWPALVLILSAVGGLVARQAARPATVSPLGLTRRRPRPLSRTAAVVPIASAVVIWVGIGVVPWGDPPWGYFLALVAAAVLAISSGPWLILLTGRLAARRNGLLNSMAGRRLLADVRTPGRVVGVMLAVGVAFGIIAVLVAEALGAQDIYDRGFFLTGAQAATIGVVVAAVVATSALAVGATEQVLDGARSTAILVALAASPSFVLKIVRRQMMLAAVPATVIGAVLGWVVYGWVTVNSEDGGWVGIAPALPVAMVVAGLAATVGALVAAQTVRPTIVTSSGPENLRTP
jgi:hypothetical protein